LDRITRKDLKTDKFAVKVGHAAEFLGEHRRQAFLIGGAALALLAIGVGTYFYRKSAHVERQKVLVEAMRLRDAYIGQKPEGADPTLRWFESNEKRDEATRKALADIVARYSGSDEADIAQYTLGAMAYDEGRIDEAERRLREVVDNGSKAWASLARFTLAQLEEQRGKAAEAEKHYRYLVANPTAMVSREQATIALASAIAASKPEEARKLLEPLRTSSRPAVSRHAINHMANLGPAPPPPPPPPAKK
jgi:tetratricopeptide (TPR) repeat protein